MKHGLLSHPRSHPSYAHDAPALVPPAVRMFGACVCMLRTLRAVSEPLFLVPRVEGGVGSAISSSSTSSTRSRSAKFLGATRLLVGVAGSMLKRYATGPLLQPPCLLPVSTEAALFSSHSVHLVNKYGRPGSLKDSDIGTRGNEVSYTDPFNGLLRLPSVLGESLRRHIVYCGNCA